MLCTSFSAYRKALISADSIKFREERDVHFCRSNVEQFRVFVKHWAAQLIRPEEESRHAGDPT